MKVTKQQIKRAFPKVGYMTSLSQLHEWREWESSQRKSEKSEIK
jgi:hypothetical protein